MHIKGNVVKIETIVQSTMPLTEIYAKAFDPKCAISTYAGNVTIYFDKDGNIKHSKGYGLDGMEIFDADRYNPRNSGVSTPSIPIGLGAKQNIDNIKTIASENGDIVNVKYYDGNDLIWNQKAYYNEDGSMKSIVKEYEQLSIKSDLITILYTDTTTFNYLEYDNLGNWVEAEVNYKGILPKHAHSYKIKRQITYMEDGKKPTLIKELRKYNKVDMTTTKETDEVHISEYGTMNIPHYMAMQPKNYINDVINLMPSYLRDQTHYLFMSVYDDKDAYASISVNYFPGDGSGNFDDLSPEELAYDKETDKILEEQNTAFLAQAGTYVLKWLPYKFVTISGRRALKISYYRYGKGNPIPVYCEIYSIPMADGNTICVSISFQSNLYNRFYKDFEQSINSIRFK